jgi:hypothetical protein
VFLTVVIAAIMPGSFAWMNSTNAKGSSKDVDFYLLIQGSIMSVLGIFTGIYPSLQKPKTVADWWVFTLAILGCICAMIAIPMYLYLPTIWSAFPSFLSMAIQCFMAMQLAIAFDTPVDEIKED